ncbi:MAG TPA: hypothetical protein VHI95_00460 [Acidimicrobiales bacterium]|jgi:hypothetical protein|nr:hypothetical protein [Acidimicrobiales bacterium]
MPEPPKTIPQVLNELWELLVAYGKQETVEPLKGLGRYIGFGLAAAVVGATGIVMLTLGTMRVLQTETNGHLQGNWNWVPYVAGLVVLGALIALAVTRITAKGTKSR